MTHVIKIRRLFYLSKRMFQTCIFFDLETTGLIVGKHMPKITELSLIAVSRNAICDETSSLPRVLSKLVLPINPVREISAKVESITGLSNKNIDNVEPFTRDTSDLIISFINRFTPPICFISYNGNQYDYPIFLWELGNINVNLNDEILSIDMMLLIKDYFKKDSVTDDSGTSCDAACSPGDFDILLNDGYDEILSDALDNVLHEKKKNDVCSDTSQQTIHYEEGWSVNERTPEACPIKQSNIKPRNRNLKAKKKLNFENSKPSNYKLITVYNHFFGTDPPNAHSAEGDCISMIKCATQIKHFFSEWADLNAVPMTNYKKQGL
ncbi:three-prime repair exonuclease 1 [Augochlora pura]